jgi:hypothetical protein
MSFLKKIWSLKMKILSVFFLTMAILLNGCSHETKSNAYSSSLPEVDSPTIPCLSCKEENAGNTGSMPPKTGVLYVKQLRQDKDNVVWHFFNGPGYIGSAKVVYVAKSSKLYWNITTSMYVNAKVVSGKPQTLEMKGAPKVPVEFNHRAKFIFDF